MILCTAGIYIEMQVPVSARNGQKFGRYSGCQKRKIFNRLT